MNPRTFITPTGSIRGVISTSVRLRKEPGASSPSAISAASPESEAPTIAGLLEELTRYGDQVVRKRFYLISPICRPVTVSVPPKVDRDSQPACL